MVITKPYVIMVMLKVRERRKFEKKVRRLLEDKLLMLDKKHDFKQATVNEYENWSMYGRWEKLDVQKLPRVLRQGEKEKRKTRSTDRRMISQSKARTSSDRLQISNSIMEQITPLLVEHGMPLERDWISELRRGHPSKSGDFSKASEEGRSSTMEDVSPWALTRAGSSMTKEDVESRSGTEEIIPWLSEHHEPSEKMESNSSTVEMKEGGDESFWVNKQSTPSASITQKMSVDIVSVIKSYRAAGSGASSCQSQEKDKMPVHIFSLDKEIFPFLMKKTREFNHNRILNRQRPTLNSIVNIQEAALHNYTLLQMKYSYYLGNEESDARYFYEDSYLVEEDRLLGLMILRWQMKKFQCANHLPYERLTIRWAQFSRVDNISFVNAETAIMSRGCHFMFVNLNTGNKCIYKLCEPNEGERINCFCTDSTRSIIAFNGAKSYQIVIMEYLTKKKLSILDDSLKEDYLYLAMGYGNLLYALRGYPSFRMTIWNWKTAELLHTMRNTVVTNDVFIRAHPSETSCYIMNTNCGLTYISKHIIHMFGRLCIVDEIELDFYPRTVVYDACFSPKNNIYFVDDNGNIYGVSPKYEIFKLYSWKVKICEVGVLGLPCKPVLQTAISWYKKGLLVLGPSGYLRYYKMKLNKSNEKIMILSLEIKRDTVKALLATNNIATKAILHCEKAGLCTIRDKKLVVIEDNSKLKVSCMDFLNPTCHYFVTAYREDIHVWSRITGQLMNSFYVTINVGAIVCHPYHPYIIATSADTGSFRVIDLRFIRKPNQLYDMWVSKQLLTSIRFSGDGKRMIILSPENRLLIFKADPKIFCFEQVYEVDVPIRSFITCRNPPSCELQILSLDVPRVNTVRSHFTLYWLPLRYGGDFYCTDTYSEIEPCYNPTNTFFAFTDHRKELHKISIDTRGPYLSTTKLVVVPLVQCFPTVPRIRCLHDHLIIYGKDGLIHILDDTDLRCFASFMNHHRFDGGTKQVIIDNRSRHVISLGEDGVLACYALPRKICGHKAHVIPHRENYIPLPYRRIKNWIPEYEAGLMPYDDWVKEIKAYKENKVYKIEITKIIQELIVLKNTFSSIFYINQMQEDPEARLSLNELCINRCILKDVFGNVMEKHKSEILEVYKKNITILMESFNMMKIFFWDPMILHLFAIKAIRDRYVCSSYVMRRMPNQFYKLRFTHINQRMIDVQGPQEKCFIPWGIEIIKVTENESNEEESYEDISDFESPSVISMLQSTEAEQMIIGQEEEEERDYHTFQLDKTLEDDILEEFGEEEEEEEDKNESSSTVSDDDDYDDDDVQYYQIGDRIFYIDYTCDDDDKGMREEFEAREEVENEEVEVECEEDEGEMEGEIEEIEEEEVVEEEIEQEEEEEEEREEYDVEWMERLWNEEVDGEGEEYEEYSYGRKDRGQITDESGQYDEKESTISTVQGSEEASETKLPEIFEGLDEDSEIQIDSSVSLISKIPELEDSEQDIEEEQLYEECEEGVDKEFVEALLELKRREKVIAEQYRGPFRIAPWKSAKTRARAFRMYLKYQQARRKLKKPKGITLLECQLLTDSLKRLPKFGYLKDVVNLAVQNMMAIESGRYLYKFERAPLLNSVELMLDSLEPAFYHHLELPIPEAPNMLEANLVLTADVLLSLFKDTIFKLKRDFNRHMISLRAEKLKEMEMVDEYNREIEELIFALRDSCRLDPQLLPNVPPCVALLDSEVPEALISVKECEVPAIKLLTPEEEALVEAALEKERELERLYKLDAWKREALIDMMDGVLKLTWKDVLKRKIPVPRFLADKLVDEFSPEEIERAKEYQKQVRDLRMKCLHYVKLVQEDIKTILHKSESSQREHDKKIRMMMDLKFELITAIGSERLKVNRLCGRKGMQSNLLEFIQIIRGWLHQQNILMSQLKKGLVRMKKEVSYLNSRYNKLRHRDKNLRTRFTVNFDANSMKALNLDKIMSLYQSRPPYSLLYNATANELRELASSRLEHGNAPYLTPQYDLYFGHIVLMNSPGFRPPGIDKATWELIIFHRKEKIICELMLEACKKDLEKGKEVVKHFEGSLQRINRDFTSTKNILIRSQSILRELYQSAELQFMFPSAHIEKDSDDEEEFYNNAVLIEASFIDELNYIIKNVTVSKTHAGESLVEKFEETSSMEFQHIYLKCLATLLHKENKLIKKFVYSSYLQKYLNIVNKTGAEPPIDPIEEVSVMKMEKLKLEELQRLDELKVEAVECRANEIKKERMAVLKERLEELFSKAPDFTETSLDAFSVNLALMDNANLDDIKLPYINVDIPVTEEEPDPMLDTKASSSAALNLIEEESNESDEKEEEEDEDFASFEGYVKTYEGPHVKVVPKPLCKVAVSTDDITTIDKHICSSILLATLNSSVSLSEDAASNQGSSTPSYTCSERSVSPSMSVDSEGSEEEYISPEMETIHTSLNSCESLDEKLYKPDRLRNKSELICSYEDDYYFNDMTDENKYFIPPGGLHFLDFKKDNFYLKDAPLLLRSFVMKKYPLTFRESFDKEKLKEEIPLPLYLTNFEDKVDDEDFTKKTFEINSIDRVAIDEIVKQCDERLLAEQSESLLSLESSYEYSVFSDESDMCSTDSEDSSPKHKKATGKVEVGNSDKKHGDERMADSGKYDDLTDGEVMDYEDEEEETAFHEKLTCGTFDKVKVGEVHAKVHVENEEVYIQNDEVNEFDHESFESDSDSDDSSLSEDRPTVDLSDISDDASFLHALIREEAKRRAGESEEQRRKIGKDHMGLKLQKYVEPDNFKRNKNKKSKIDFNYLLTWRKQKIHLKDKEHVFQKLQGIAAILADSAEYDPTLPYYRQFKHLKLECELESIIKKEGLYLLRHIDSFHSLYFETSDEDGDENQIEINPKLEYYIDDLNLKDFNKETDDDGSELCEPPDNIIGIYDVITGEVAPVINIPQCPSVSSTSSDDTRQKRVIDLPKDGDGDEDEYVGRRRRGHRSIGGTHEKSHTKKEKHSKDYHEGILLSTSVTTLSTSSDEEKEKEIDLLSIASRGIQYGIHSTYKKKRYAKEKSLEVKIRYTTDTEDDHFHKKDYRKNRRFDYSFNDLGIKDPNIRYLLSELHKKEITAIEAAKIAERDKIIIEPEDLEEFKQIYGEISDEVMGILKSIEQTYEPVHVIFSEMEKTDPILATLTKEQELQRSPANAQVNSFMMQANKELEFQMKVFNKRIQESIEEGKKLLERKQDAYQNLVPELNLLESLQVKDLKPHERRKRLKQLKKISGLLQVIQNNKSDLQQLESELEILHLRNYPTFALKKDVIT
ncbi:uncharacterized protein LOC106667207 [Cimex lectularius]|uniref:Cilia- and flagella-associated protein 43 n=1 Tax=Cimex lectularius TaxID=79782 RepID=A0A8I6RQ50_CIMLE|nr:uncharacterized protein LOC106667207 [Cimex lectularius]